VGIVILTDERDRLARHMLEALMAGNAHRASAVAGEGFDAGMSLTELFDDVLSPALCHVGERWQDGLVRHTQERFATVAAEALVERISPAAPAAGAPRWVAASVEGDRHRVGVSMAAATLRATGAEARVLFESTVADLVAAGRGAAGVCLSCSGPWSVMAARQAAEAIAATGTPVVLGGGGWAGWEQPPAIRQVGSMTELASVAVAGARTASV
jgi:B12 binding protein